jgi:hypothetical protein
MHGVATVPQIPGHDRVMHGANRASFDNNL